MTQAAAGPATAGGEWMSATAEAVSMSAAGTSTGTAQRTGAVGETFDQKTG